MSERSIEFDSQGTRCVGVLYLPEGAAPEGGHPTIVMAHGFSGVKEMLVPYAAHFRKNGFAVLTFDYRCLGGSGGEPRYHIVPAEQIEDYRNAISFATELPEVDAARIGLWGTSMSGGHVICLGHLERRIKCISAQVPLIDGLETVPPEAREALYRRLEADRLERMKTGAVNYMPIAAEDGKSGLFPGRDSWEAMKNVEERVPTWANRITMDSVEKFIEYVPAVYLPRVAPTPFQMIVAAQDTLTPHAVAVAAFETAGEPKRLKVLPCGHFEAYTVGFDESAGSATEWFRQYLG